MQAVIGIFVWLFICVVLGNFLTGGYTEHSTEVALSIFLGAPIAIFIILLVYGISTGIHEKKVNSNDFNSAKKAPLTPQARDNTNFKDNNKADNRDTKNWMDTPLQERINDAIKQYNHCLTVDEIIDCYLKNTPKDEWLRSIHIEVLRYYIVHKSPFKKSISLNYVTLKNMIEDKSANRIRKLDLPLGARPKKIAPKISMPTNIENDNDKPTIAEYIVEDTINTNASYTSQKILYSENTTKRAQNISKYEQMRKIRPSADYYHNSTKETFYLQAKFMETFEENFKGNEDFFEYSPTYEDMSLNQLKTYFTWRTDVRNGKIHKTSLSYAYVYIYELLNQIGISNSTDGLEKLIDFYFEYREHDRHLDRYVPEWIKQYIVVYDCPLNELDRLPKDIEDNSKLLLHAIEIDNYENFTELLNKRSNYKIIKSRFYGEYSNMYDDVLACVMKEIKKFYQQRDNNIKQLIDNLIGKEIMFDMWMPFRRAVVFYKKKNETREVQISGYEKYQCKNGNWTLYTRNNYDYNINFVAALLKTTEYYLRMYTSYPYRINLETSKKSDFSLSLIIQKSIIAYCEDKELFGIAKKTKVNKHFEKEVLKKEPIKINIDFEKLQSIRDDANEIKEKLLENSNYDNASEDLPVKENALTNINIVKTNSDIISEDDNFKLTPLHQEVLEALLKEDDSIAIDAILKNKGLFLEVVLEDINSICFNKFNDNIINTNATPPCIYNEYLNEVESLL